MGGIDETHVLPCWLEVDLDAVTANVAALQRWVGPRTELAAVLKADAYGTGVREMAPAVLAAGVQSLAVARVHEGVELRQSGARVPILVMNRADPEEADIAVLHDLTLTVDSVELAHALAASAGRQGTSASVHLKVDTGLHRFGVEPQAALPLARAMAGLDGLEVQALYTHFASADENDPRFTQEQIGRFERVTQDLAASGYRFPMRHACNSAGTLAFPQAHYDMVRIGLTLYGVSPSGEIPRGLALNPVLAFKARIARICELAPGDGIGYGQTWHARRPTRVALVTAGYADGVRRGMSNRGCAIVQGQQVPLIGRVSMDQTTLDITSIPNVSVGDEVTFFGGEGEASIDLASFAASSDTIPHEALTSIGGRVARVYRRAGRVAKIARLSGTSEVTSYAASAIS